MILINGVKTVGKVFKAKVMHLTEGQAGWLVVSAVGLNAVALALWALS